MPEEKRKILIIDDETDFVRSTAYRLKFEGFETLEAANSEEAMALMERVTPDLILLDVMMPGMSGVEFYKQLRNNKRLEKLPIIFLTVWDQLVPANSRESNGQAMLVTKPFEFETLLKTIREMLEKSEH